MGYPISPTHAMKPHEWGTQIHIPSGAKARTYLRNENKYGDSGCARMTSENLINDEQKSKG
jgi:hypothetical protein